MNLVYIGDKFYNKSGTIMSSIYEVVGKNLKRSDWGFVKIALGNGEEIHIRQATPEEIEWAETTLHTLHTL